MKYLLIAFAVAANLLQAWYNFYMLDRLSATEAAFMRLNREGVFSRLQAAEQRIGALDGTVRYGVGLMTDHISRCHR